MMCCRDCAERLQRGSELMRVTLVTSVFLGLAYISERRQDVIRLLPMCGVVNRMSAGMSGLYLCFAVNTEMSLSRIVTFVSTTCLTHCQIFRLTSRESRSSFCFAFYSFNQEVHIQGKHYTLLMGILPYSVVYAAEGGVILNAEKHVYQ